MKKWDTVVVGGGASGMICALLLGRAGKSVLLLEANDRLGKKIAVSGNGQGNLTNTRLSLERYHGATELVKYAISRFGYRECADFYQGIGCLLAEGKEGRVYPSSFQASSVIDNLRYALAAAGVQVITHTRVNKVYARAREWFVRTENKEFCAESTVLAFGGAASPSLGTDGSSFALARALGHTVTPLTPSLVQLTTERGFLKGLKGVKTDACVSVERNGEKIISCRGDVLFTDYGVSGNAVFTVSGYALEGNSVLHLEFLPDISCQRLAEACEQKIKAMPDLPVEELFSGILTKQVGRSVLRHAEISLNARAADVLPRLPALCRAVKNIPLAVTGSTGLVNAQVTRGGVCGAELKDHLESKLCPNLFFTGEAVDVDGDCGGFNLHWAFASASVVAQYLLNKR